ncbi:hypothetical protein E2K80_14195 [Rhodophyticola sp. CCM32]|uniref:outer membrane protein n=1 Tax=Rhodophyticola sp. CCM32 TaxID=2916397 RepID=UPI00107FAE36|nr:outer membrane beta-barrel protein [Rhodophyticola sp. CCM32]QBY01735.1 hypothetical protein E2K80_14195 [Rhodophyticola sp. CCM32]
MYLKDWIIAAFLCAVSSQKAEAEEPFVGYYGGIGIEHGSHSEGGLNMFSASVDGLGNVLVPHDDNALSILFGYTASRGDWIVGIEAQYAATDVNFGETACTAALPYPCADAFLLAKRENTLRIRGIAGQPVGDNFLLFATFGASVSQLSLQGLGVIGTNGSGASTERQRFLANPIYSYALGVSLGVGVEHRITDAFSLRGEVMAERIYLDTSSTARLRALQRRSTTDSVIQLNDDHIHFDNVSVALTAIYRF